MVGRQERCVNQPVMRTFIRYILHGHGQPSRQSPATIPHALDWAFDCTRTSNIGSRSSSFDLNSDLKCSRGLSESLEHRFGKSVVVDEDGRRAICSWGRSESGSVVETRRQRIGESVWLTSVSRIIINRTDSQKEPCSWCVKYVE